MAEAVRDQNNVPSLLGVSSVDLTTPTRIAANPTTKALLIDSTSLYAGLDTRYQPLDSDLTTIAGLTATTDNFLVSVSSAWASRTPSQVRTTLGLVIGTDVQAYDADLTTWAGITPAAGIGTFLATPTSANLLSAVTDETGSGSLVFATSPVFTTNISTPLIIGAGAIGITPAAGSNLNITLATTGDLAVNADDLYVDTSTGNVGIGTTAPGAKLHILGSNQNTLALDSTTYPEMTLRVSGTIKSYDAIATSAGGYFTGSILNSRIFYSVSDVFQFGGASGSYMTINGGNVGIGTTGPNYKLEVNGTSGFQNTVSVLAGNTIDLYESTNNNRWRMQNDVNNFKLYFNAVAPAVTVLSGGNVGIGTTTPLAKLDILGTDDAAPYYGIVQIRDATAMAQGVGGSIGFLGDYGSGNQTNAAYIKAYKENATGSNYAFALTLGTRPNGGAMAERVRIDSTGNVGIGTTGPTSLLHIQKDQNAFTIANLKNATADTGAAVRWQAVASTITTFFDTYSSGYTTAGQLRQSGAAFGTDGSGGLSILATTGDIRFAGGTADSAERMVIKNAGNVGIGTTGPDKVLEVNLGTASALRLTYNDANGSAATYMDTTVSSVGLTTFTATGSAPAFALNAKLGLKGYTVAALPTGAEGDIVYVTDQLTAAAAKGVAPTGGGAVKCVVFHNGTAWVGI